MTVGQHTVMRGFSVVEEREVGMLLKVPGRWLDLLIKGKQDVKEETPPEMHGSN